MLARPFSFDINVIQKIKGLYKAGNQKIVRDVSKLLETAGQALRVTEENKSPNLLAFCPFFGVAQKVT